MKKEIINHLIYYIVFFVFLTVANSLYSFSYWPMYIGGLVGLFLPNVDHLLHVFVFKSYELTSQRALMLYRNKQYKDILILLYNTREERKDLVFHGNLFQIVFTVLTFWVITSSGDYFGRGLVLAYYLSLVIFNLKKFVNKELIFGDTDQSRIYFAVQILLLLIFGLSI